MANIETRVNKFIADNGIDESFKDELINFVNGCFTDYVSNISKNWLKSTVVTKRPEKVSKKDKLEDPSDATTIDDLNNCTSVILNEYCKKNSIKVGGNKKEIKERVWKHLQGEPTDSSVVSKKSSGTKKGKNIAHACIANNNSGNPCGLSASQQFGGEWFCFKHIDNAEQIIARSIAEKEPEGQDSGDESESETKQKVIKIKSIKKKTPVVEQFLDEED